MRQLALLNPENASEQDVADYPVREAVRAIVIDNDSNIALLHVSRESYYKLPGGGIEGTEDHKMALQRECLEEIGCEVEVIDEIGSIVEYKKTLNLKQISYCYFAKIKGEKGSPNFTDEDIRNGSEQLWLPYIEALKCLNTNITTSFEAHNYIVPRDIVFLSEGKRFLI